MSRADMLKDLKRSGLTDADARKASYKPLSATETKELTGIYAESYLIPYHDSSGDVTEFWRVRYTSTPRKAFSVISKKPPRYSQLINTLPRFYFPKRTNWKAFNKDASEPLAITEGEKKAEKANKEGIPCIAVGGVWAWRSKKKGLAAIPDFDLIKWGGRTVWLVFDNDLMTNPLVIGALAGLSNELHKRGAKVFIKFLPKGPGKIGLDDYLLKRDAKAFIKLREDEYKKSELLWQLNDRLAFIEKVNATWDFKHQTMYPTKQSLIQQFDNLTYQEPKANGGGFITKKAAEQWSAWPYKHVHQGIGYFPGDESVVTDANGVDRINTWPGWKCLPKPGTVKPFLDLIDFLFEDAPDQKVWFMKWLAYPLQHPGTKLMQVVLLHSRTQGVGKSFVGEIVGEIYGENFNIVSQDELHSSFNEWLVGKQFILGEELSGGDNRKDADRLKNMFTRKLFNVNIKFQPNYVMQDCANYLLTSNRVDALFLDDDDRRAFVHEIKSKAKPENFYKRIGKWLDNGGASHLFHYLLNVETSKFNPRAPAPRTVARQNMIDLSKSDLDIWAAQVLKNPDDVFRLGDTIVERELFTATELISFAPKPGGRDASTIGISKSLRRVDICMHELGTHKGTKKLFAVRNSKAWEKRTDRQWAEHYKIYYGERQSEKFE